LKKRSVGVSALLGRIKFARSKVEICILKPDVDCLGGQSLIMEVRAFEKVAWFIRKLGEIDISDSEDDGSH
jgi:hypothetical protein